MRYFILTLGLSLRERLRSGRFWMALLLILAAGIAARWAKPAADAVIQVGAVIPAGGESFQEALEDRNGEPVRFVFTDEATARRQVAAGRWDCALLLSDDFEKRLETGELDGVITLVTGPGSTIYPLVRETAAAVLLELTSAGIAAEYLSSSGISASAQDMVPRLRETLSQIRRVQITMETLEGRPLDTLTLTGDGMARSLRGGLAAVLLVWTLYAAVDLGRWRESGAAKRMLPCLGGMALTLPRLLTALIPAFLLGAVGILAAGGPVQNVLSLIPYLAALGALELLLTVFRPVWEALPAVIPFAAASAFILSPVFVDITLLFPGLSPVCRWLPVTLYLRGCEGEWSALGRLIVLTAAFIAAAATLETLRENNNK